MLRMAAGGARAEAESGRMVTEKILATGEAQLAAAAAAMRGRKKHVVAGKALNVYRKRVRANKRRLSRRKVRNLGRPRAISPARNHLNRPRPQRRITASHSG